MKGSPTCATRARRISVGSVLVLLLATLLVQSLFAGPQSKPLDRSRVMALTVRTGDANGEISSLIERQGIAFAPTLQDLQAFRDAGARENLLNALQRAKVVPPPETAVAENQLVFRHLADGAAKAFLCSQEWGSEKKPGVCEEAEREVRAAIAEDPRSASSHYALGALFVRWVYVKGLPPAAAVAELREAVRLEPDFAEAHEELGDALARANDMDGAVAELRESIHRRPDLLGAHIKLQETLKKSKGLEGAIQAIKEDVQREPDIAAYHFDLVQLYRESGNLEGVIAECNEAIRLNPTDSTYHFVLGHALLDGKGDAAAAIPHFREAVRLGDKLEPGINRFNLAIALVANGSFDEALTELRETRRVFPTPGVDHYIVLALLGKGDSAATLAELHPLIQKYPENAFYHAALALVYGRQGDFDKAVAECSVARKLPPDDEGEVKAICDEVERRAHGSRKSEGVGGRQAPAPQATTTIALKDRFHAVEVKKFDVQEGTDLPTDYVQSLQDEIVKEFGKWQQFKQVLLPGQNSAGAAASTLRLSGTVTYFDPGNRAGRYFGSGKGQIVVHVAFGDLSTGETLVTDQVCATLSGGIFGGNARNITHEFAKTLSDTTKLLLEKPVPSPGELASPEAAGPRPPAADRKIVTISSDNYDQGQADLNTQASAGYRLIAFTPKGLERADVTLERSATQPQVFQYRVLRAHQFSNLQKDLNKAALDGYRYCPNTLAWLAGGFGGVGFAIVEKSPVPSKTSYEYRVHAATQVSNAQKDVAKDQRENFSLVATLVTERHIALMERKVVKAGE